MTIPTSGRHRSNSDTVTRTSNSTSHAFSASNSILPPSSFKGIRYLEDGSYPNATTFISNDSTMTITVNSPSVRSSGRPRETALPVFGDHDRIPGTVSLNTQFFSPDVGKLTISIEGVFEYISPMSATKAGPSQITPGRHTHVFYRDEAVIPLYAASEPTRSRPALRSALASIRRSASQERILRTPLPKVRSMEFGFRRDRSSSSASSSSSSCSSGSSSTVSWTSADSSTPAAKTFNFSFELPKTDRMGGELPPSFSSSNVVSAGVRGRVYAENADVRYRITTVWEALDGSGAQTRLEAPILFQPDADFQSLDGIELSSDSWHEIPLSVVSNASNVPIECAVTLPQPASFPRRTTVPYYVVFTTKPRSRSLAAEVMTDATIAVSLVRKVGFYKSNSRHRAALISAPSPPSSHVRTRSRRHAESPGLSSSKSIGDLRSLRRKLRDVMPPMHGFDSSGSFQSSSSGMDSRTSAAESPPTPPTPPSARTAANLTSADFSGTSKEKARKHMLKRVVRSAPPALSAFRFGLNSRGADAIPDSASNPSSSVWQKPLPSIPQEGKSNDRNTSARRTCPPAESNNVTQVEATASSDRCRVTDSRTLHTDVSVGFPKRPKVRTVAEGSHPSLETVNSLPDGLYKGSIPLQKGWFPSLRWDGLTIEYFLEVSVIFDNTVFKGHVPIRLF